MAYSSNATSHWNLTCHGEGSKKKRKRYFLQVNKFPISKFRWLAEYCVPNNA